MRRFRKWYHFFSMTNILGDMALQSVKFGNFTNFGKFWPIWVGCFFTGFFEILLNLVVFPCVWARKKCCKKISPKKSLLRLPHPKKPKWFFHWPRKKIVFDFEFMYLKWNISTRRFRKWPPFSSATNSLGTVGLQSVKFAKIEKNHQFWQIWHFEGTQFLNYLAQRKKEAIFGIAPLRCFI